jgi:hypothetical protein
MNQEPEQEQEHPDLSDLEMDDEEDIFSDYYWDCQTYTFMPELTYMYRTNMLTSRPRRHRCEYKRKTGSSSRSTP